MSIENILTESYEQYRSEDKEYRLLIGRTPSIPRLVLVGRLSVFRLRCHYQYVQGSCPNGGIHGAWVP
jgi:hypothetical protein